METPLTFPVRINKYLSHKGLASRREADTLIQKGLILINKKQAKLGALVYEKDVVEISSKRKEKECVYVAYYKPRGSVTHNAQHGEKDVAEQFKKQGLFPLGRLDKDSEGLMILTNDGLITEKLLSPKHEHEKEYVVTTREKIRSGIPAILAKGMDTYQYGTLKPAKAEIVDDNTIRIILSEGKKHQVRIMLTELRLTVSKLKRVRIMNIKLGKLRPGETREIKGKELEDFLSSLSQ